MFGLIRQDKFARDTTFFQLFEMFGTQRTYCVFDYFSLKELEKAI